MNEFILVGNYFAETEQLTSRALGVNNQAIIKALKKTLAQLTHATLNSSKNNKAKKEIKKRALATLTLLNEIEGVIESEGLTVRPASPRDKLHNRSHQYVNKKMAPLQEEQ